MIKKTQQLMKGCGKEFTYRKNEEVIIETKCGFWDNKKRSLCPFCERARKQMLEDCKEFFDILNSSYIARHDEYLLRKIKELQQTIKVLERKE